MRTKKTLEQTLTALYGLTGIPDQMQGLAFPEQQMQLQLQTSACPTELHQQNSKQWYMCRTTATGDDYQEESMEPTDTLSY